MIWVLIGLAAFIFSIELTIAMQGYNPDTTNK